MGLVVGACRVDCGRGLDVLEVRTSDWVDSVVTMCRNKRIHVLIGHESTLKYQRFRQNYDTRVTEGLLAPEGYEGSTCPGIHDVQNALLNYYKCENTVQYGAIW